MSRSCGDLLLDGGDSHDVARHKDAAPGTLVFTSQISGYATASINGNARHLTRPKTGGPKEPPPQAGILVFGDRLMLQEHHSRSRRQLSIWAARFSSHCRCG